MPPKPITKMSYRELSIQQLLTNEKVAASLNNLDQHTKDQNGRLDKQEEAIDANTNKISHIRGVGFGVISILGIVIVVLTVLLAIKG